MKKSKGIIISLSVLLIVGFATFIILKPYGSTKKLDKVALKNSSVNNSGLFAIMLETGVDSNEYKESTLDETWQDQGYEFNTEKSGCIDTLGNKISGEILKYDTTTHLATVDTNTTAYCYLYFDLNSSAN